MQTFEPGSSVAEGSDCGDQRLNLDLTASDHLHGIRILSRRGARSLKSNLPRHYLLKRNLDFGGDVADKSDCSALPNAIDASGDSLLKTYSLEYHVHTITPGYESNLIDQCPSRGIKRAIGSEVRGEFESGLIHVRDVYPRCAIRTRGLQEQQPDHTSTNDEDNIIFNQVGDTHPMKGYCYRFEHRRLWERQTIGKLIDDPSGNCYELSECPGPPIFFAGHPDHLSVTTEVDLTAQAVIANTAEDSRIESHTITWGKRAHLGSDLYDNARGLVTHHDGRNPATCRPIVPMHIAAAYTASGDLNQKFIRIRHRLWQITNFQVAIFCEQQGFHITETSFFRFWPY